MTGKKIAWTIAVAVAAILVGLLVLRAHRLRLVSEAQLIPIEGAVIQSDPDVQNQLPIAGVAITASDGVKSATTQSDAAGYFKLVLKKGVLSDRPVTVTFERAGYQPFEITVQTGRLKIPKQLYVARMKPIAIKAPVKASPKLTVVSNIRVRYTINARTDTNIGSAVKTFQVVNKGDVPCDPHSLCSPDGKWRAASASVSLDAGADNSFGNIRASCIAGPCPFTRIDSRGFVNGGRNISVSALNWSDTATFLLQAEVSHTAIGANVRELHPVQFGQALNFTVPPSQEGVSLEAELDGAPMVFPLGPNLSLSWATCSMRNGTEEEQTVAYRCELKPGYRF
jgi:hypothetical protein